MSAATLLRDCRIDALREYSRPILFRDEMVRALVAGRKTQTRRVVKPQPVRLPPDGYRPGDALMNPRTGKPFYSPYGGPGELLYVREAWRKAYAKTYFSDGIVYRADGPPSLGMDEYSERHRWRPSIHMLRRASRLTLRVTEVRVERVRDISEGDAVAEGIEHSAGWGGYHVDNGKCFHGSDPRESFRKLWDSMRAGTELAWDRSPWVWVVGFDVIHKNIDTYIKELASAR